MNWKDTVLRKEELENLRFSLRREIAEKQAKISFKEGQRQLLDELDKATENSRLEDIFDTLFYWKQEKRKELDG